MSLVEEEALILEDAGAIDAKGMVELVFKALHGVALGWRLPSQHGEREEQASEDIAQAKVLAAIEKGRRDAGV